MRYWRNTDFWRPRPRHVVFSYTLVVVWYAFGPLRGGGPYILW
jgi:hypothetical protein